MNDSAIWVITDKLIEVFNFKENRNKNSTQNLESVKNVLDTIY